MAVAIVLRAVGKVGAVVEYLAEVLEPSAVHHRSVGKDERAPEVHVLDHLQSREGLAEAHLGIPQHLVALPELALGLLYGIALLGTEDDGCAVVRYLCRGERLAPLLDGGDGTLHSLKVGDEPLVGLVGRVEHLLLDARALKHVVHLLVVERAEAPFLTIIYGKLRIQEVVGDACRLGVLVDALLRRVVERLAVGREAEDVVAVARGFAHFQATLVCCIIDAEHIDEFQFQ